MSKIKELFQIIPLFRKAADDIQQVAWYKSGAVWTNLFTLAGSAGALFFGKDFLSDEQVQAFSSFAPQIASGVVAAVGAVNLALRIGTSKPVGLKTVKSGPEDLPIFVDD